MKENNDTVNLRKILLATGLFLTTPIVAAQDENAFSSIVDIIQDLAIGIGQIVTLGGIENSTPVLQAIYFLMIFTAFFMGGLIAFGGRSNMDAKQARKYSAIFAALIALTATIVTPTSFVTTLSGTLSLIIMSLMFLAIIALPLFVMYKLVPDVSGQNDMFVGMTKVILSIVSILVISIYANLIEGMNEQEATNVASEGIGGALAQPIVEIIGTLTGIVLLIFVVTFGLGIKQAWPKSKNKKSSSGNEWYKNLGPSDKNLLNNEIETTVKDLDDIRRGQSPVRERIQDYLKDAKKELHKPTGGSLSKVLGYLKNMLEDIDGDGRDKTLKDELQEQRDTWEKHKRNLRKYNEELRSLPKRLEEVVINMSSSKTDKAEVNLQNLTEMYKENGDSYLQGLNLNKNQTQKLKHTLDEYYEYCSGPMNFEELDEYLHKLNNTLQSDLIISLNKIKDSCPNVPNTALELFKNYKKYKNQDESYLSQFSLNPDDLKEYEDILNSTEGAETLGDVRGVELDQDSLELLNVIVMDLKEMSVAPPSNVEELLSEYYTDENYLNRFSLDKNTKQDIKKVLDRHKNIINQPKSLEGTAKYFENQIRKLLNELSAVLNLLGRNSVPAPKNMLELTQNIVQNKQNLQKYFNKFDLTDAERSRAIKTANIYLSEFDEPKSHKNIQKEIDRLQPVVKSQRIEKDFDKLEKDLSELENYLMQKVGDLGDQMRKQAAKENPPKSRKEAHNMLQRIDNKMSTFRNDFEILRKDVANVENVLA